MSNYFITNKQELLLLEYSKDENCEDDLLQGKFKHFKGCINTDGKDELGKDYYELDLTDKIDLARFHIWVDNLDKETLGEINSVGTKENGNPYSHAWLKLNRKDKLNYLKKGDELLEYIKDAFYEALEYSDLYLYEDRHKSILEMYDDGLIDYPDKYVRATDIFTIGLQLSQMVRYGSIIKDTKKHGTIPKVKLDINESKKARLPRFLKKHHEIRV